jgi:hypothetical protein
MDRLYWKEIPGIDTISCNTEQRGKTASLWQLVLSLSMELEYRMKSLKL